MALTIPNIIGKGSGSDKLVEAGSETKHKCESCEESFTNAGDFIFYMENNHKTADVIFLQDESWTRFLWKIDYN